MNDSNCILTAANLSRDFDTPEGKLSVLSGVNFEIKKGEMVSITGESGVGKSTLLYLLGGLDKPTTGEVHIGGQKLGGQTEEGLANFRKKKVGFFS